MTTDNTVDYMTIRADVSKTETDKAHKIKIYLKTEQAGNLGEHGNTTKTEWIPKYMIIGNVKAKKKSERKEITFVTLKSFWYTKMLEELKDSDRCYNPDSDKFYLKDYFYPKDFGLTTCDICTKIIYNNNFFEEKGKRLCPDCTFCN